MQTEVKIKATHASDSSEPPSVASPQKIINEMFESRTDGIDLILSQQFTPANSSPFQSRRMPNPPLSSSIKFSSFPSPCGLTLPFDSQIASSPDLHPTPQLYDREACVTTVSTLGHEHLTVVGLIVQCFLQFIKKTAKHPS